jgi:hypothetical protein
LLLRHEIIAAGIYSDYRDKLKDEQNSCRSELKNSAKQRNIVGNFTVVIIKYSILLAVLEVFYQHFLDNCDKIYSDATFFCLSYIVYAMPDA